MNAEQKLKHLILNQLATLRSLTFRTDLTVENIDAEYQFEYENDSDSFQDAKAEVRNGEFWTKLDSRQSRIFKSIEVASKAPDGTWIGWTHWFGGGKHDDPETIEWIEFAYDVTMTVTEEKITVTSQTFAKVEPSAGVA